MTTRFTESCVLQRTNAHFTMLNVYLLGKVDFDVLLQLQRRLVYEVSGERDQAALLLCEHDPLISVGREGSRSQIHFDTGELLLKGWPVRWVNRGGGCLLHSPGQVMIYPILPLNKLGLDLPDYLAALRAVGIAVASDVGVRGATGESRGVAVDGRLVAHVGVAVRDWISYFGMALNVNPDLEPYRRVDCGGPDSSMTSLERERRLAVNPALVQQRVVERFMERFDLPRVTVHHEHPMLPHHRSSELALPPAKSYFVVRSLLGADAPDV